MYLITRLSQLFDIYVMYRKVNSVGSTPKWRDRCHKNSLNINFCRFIIDVCRLKYSSEVISGLVTWYSDVDWLYLF